MQKNIIKNTDLDKKVSDTKVSVNQKQVIESQKEAVEDSKSIEKIFKDKDEPQRVQFRDYSGKIKYDQLNSNNIKDDISCSDNIKLDNNKNSPQKEKNTIENRVLKENRDEIINSTETNTGFKYSESYVNESIKGEVTKYKTNYIKGFSESIYQKNTKSLITQKQKSRKIVKNNIDDSVVKNKYELHDNLSQGSFDEIVKNNDNIISENGTVVSFNNKKTASLRNKINGKRRTFKYIDTSLKSNMAKNVLLKKQDLTANFNKMQINIVSHSQKDFISTSSNEYLESSAFVLPLEKSNFSKIVHRKMMKNLSSNNLKNISNILSDNNEINYYSNEDMLKSIINTSNKNEEAFQYVDTTENYSYADNTTVNSNALQKNNIINSKKSNDYITSKKKEKGFNSSIKTKITDNVISGDRRNKSYNKADIDSKIEQFGIKAEIKNDIKKTVLEANSDIKKTVLYGGNSLKRNIKSKIEEKGEESYTYKAIDTVIKSADAIETSINTIKSSTKTLRKISNGVKKSPQSTIKGINKLKNTVRKINKFKRLKRYQQSKIVNKFIKATFKKALRIVVSAFKGVTIKFLGGIIAILLLIVIITSAIVAAISSVLWQTSDELDTTQIVKYISELDYQQQNKWFQGKTNVEIERHNDKSSSKWSYHYLLAIDTPPDELLPNGTIPPESEMHCVYKQGMGASGNSVRVTYRGFNREFSSADDMLENYRWTTEDYRAALAYLQVKKTNLGWLANTLGWVGEMQLKSAASELHKLTYDYSIVEKYVDGDNVTFNYVTPIAAASYSNNNGYNYYYFGRKYTVKYLIDNDMVLFSDDATENKKLKEQFNYICKYGNVAVANLKYPLKLGSGEKISDKIVKHFGKQLVIKYKPPQESESGSDVYGSISKTYGYHYANDLIGNAGDIIYAPISGLCTVSAESGRGYEFQISTAYSDNDFDYSKKGYVVKISCAGSTNIAVGTKKVVHKGDAIGTLGNADNMSVNYSIPSDCIFASKLYPCNTGTRYSDIGANEFDEPSTQYDHLHIEMYKLPCDFNNVADIEKNVLAPELFFDYTNEDD